MNSAWPNGVVVSRNELNPESTELFQRPQEVGGILGESIETPHHNRSEMPFAGIGHSLLACADPGTKIATIGVGMFGPCKSLPI